MQLRLLQFHKVWFYGHKCLKPVNMDQNLWDFHFIDIKTFYATYFKSKDWLIPFMHFQFFILFIFDTPYFLHSSFPITKFSISSFSSNHKNVLFTEILTKLTNYVLRCSRKSFASKNIMPATSVWSGTESCWCLLPYVIVLYKLSLETVKQKNEHYASNERV